MTETTNVDGGGCCGGECDCGGGCGCGIICGC